MNDNFIFEVSFVTLLSKLIAKISSSLEKAMLTSSTFSPLYHQSAQSTQKHLLVYSQRDISGPRKPNKRINLICRYLLRSSPYVSLNRCNNSDSSWTISIRKDKVQDYLMQFSAYNIRYFNCDTITSMVANQS